MLRCLVSLLNIFVLLSAQQFLIEYGKNGESIELFKYLNGSQQNSLYVNIGSQHPLVNSSTTYLYANNWKGINTTPHPKNIIPFYKYLKYDTNINMAIRDDKTFMSLKELPSRQIVLEQIKSNDSIEIKNLGADELVVPSSSLGSLCQKYYTKKPILLNVGYLTSSSVDISKNVWNNSKCRPSIVVFHLGKNQPVQTHPNQILAQHNYTLVDITGARQIYIENQSIEFYKQQKIKNQKLFSKVKVMSLSDVGAKISKKLSISNVLQMDNSLALTQIFPYFSRLDEPIAIRKLWKIAENSKTNKILILQFNPLHTYFILENKEYRLIQLNLGDGLNVFLLEIQGDKEKLQIYIVDHKHQEYTEIPIKVILKNQELLQQDQNIYKLEIISVIFSVISCVLGILLIKKRQMKNWEKINGSVQLQSKEDI